MKAALRFSFVTLGVTSLIAQVTLVRELMTVLYGNEFFIGWTLFSWLFWVAAGSLLLRRERALSSGSLRPLAACHALAAVLLPAEIALIRASRVFSGAVPGELPNLLPSLAWAFLGLAPLCLVLGAQFVIGAHAWEKEAGRGKLGGATGRAYVYETIGFVAGGLLFGYGLVTANEFRVAAVVGWANVIAGSLVYARPPHRSFALRATLVAVSTVVAIVFFRAPWANSTTARWRFPGQDLVASRNSIYGNVAVTRIGRQFNFYENGLLLGADREEMAGEYLAHFPLLYHPAPKRILLIGGGFNGLLPEILKHSPEKVDYVELDPVLVQTAVRYLPDDLRAALNDPRVRLVTTDARAYLRAGDGKYDVVLVNLPNPSTILINRFYTEEFLARARDRLRPGGLFATHLSFAPDYLSRELENLGASIHKTLRAVFGRVILLPEYSLFFIASPDAPLGYDPAELVRRFRERRIEAKYLVPAYIEYRLTTDRIAQVGTALESNASARENRDAWPAACYYNLAWWMSSFQPRAARWAGRLGALPPAIPALAALLFAPLLAGGRRGRSARVPAAAMAAGSFTLMACEVLIIYAYQVSYGYLYYRIGLIIAALMLGMAGGTWTSTEMLDRTSRRTLAGVHAGLILFALSSWLLFAGRAAGGAAPVGEPVFLAMAALAGAVVGFEFPAANRLYLAARGNDPGRAGTIYGVDLAGSCAGALLVGMWLLPVYGVGGAASVLIALNVPVAVLSLL